ncbi:hypothetical protein [Candidatus Odyssella thessalonicensis]|uniref:hypothetical protein n=1 Tax=Candidatus Odyssella thessalonicensis TaxID=84647 RepID=UPI000225A9ED|nr:hypothetical protein [Candidatus Odyssella thessalonicensis]
MFLNRLNMVEALKSLVAKWKQNNLIFSYKITCSASPLGPQIILHQNQTDYRITIKLHDSIGSLIISSFNVEESPELEDTCQPLFDAALIELMLQSLTVIIFCAQQLNKNDVCFRLSEDEAKHFSTLSDIFSTTSYCMTVDGKRQTLILPTWEPYSEILFNYINDMKIKLWQVLWAEQKSSNLLRIYLQNPNRFTVSLARNPKTLQKETFIPSKKENVVYFPKVFNF